MFIKRITLISMMTCVISLCSWLTFPSPVPFTMQTFAVFCALLLIGGKDGMASIVLYIFMGCIGLPVFSGIQGGIGHILGPTGGYIIGFVFTAFCYIVFEPLAQKNKILEIIILVLGLLLCYVTGTLWFKTIYGMRGIDYSFFSVLSACVLPYIIPDVLKLFLALFVCKRIKKALNGKAGQ